MHEDETATPTGGDSAPAADPSGAADVDEEDWERRVADFTAGRRNGARATPSDAGLPPASYQPDPAVYEPPEATDEQPRRRRFALRRGADDDAEVQEIGASEDAGDAVPPVKRSRRGRSRPAAEPVAPRHAAGLGGSRTPPGDALRGVATWTPDADAREAGMVIDEPEALDEPVLDEPAPADETTPADRTTPAERVSGGTEPPKSAAPPEKSGLLSGAMGGLAGRLRGLRKSGSDDEEYEPFLPPEVATPEQTPPVSTPAQSTPAQSTPAQSTPAQSTPAGSTRPRPRPSPRSAAVETPAPQTPAQRPRPRPRPGIGAATPSLVKAPAPAADAGTPVPTSDDMTVEDRSVHSTALDGGVTAPDTSPSDTSPSDTSPSDTSPSDASPSDASPSDTTAKPTDDEDEDGVAKDAPPPRPLRERLRATKTGRRLTKLVILVVVVLLAALALRSYVVAPYYIPSQSMEPTLHGCMTCNDDHVLVDKLSYRFHQPHAGDIVVFDKPPNLDVPDPVLIKRVIGVGGDLLVLKHGKVFVNGQRVSEPYFKYHSQCPGGKRVTVPLTGRKRWQIPTDDVFVMGDNRCESEDSRVFGPIPDSSIIGRAFVIVWPLGRFTFL